MNPVSSRGSEPPFLLEPSKLAPPPPRPGTVRRVGLLDRLRAASDVPVTSIGAPAGYGKSALLGQWAEQAPHRVAWLSLEREDNDPVVMSAYVAAALEGLGPADERPLRLRTARGVSVATIVARRVAASLAALDEPVVLVLDHTEHLENPQCRDAIGELALHLPASARLVVASRGGPPVPLPRLRASGAVLELGPSDLAMDEAEARLVLDGLGVQLGEAELSELVRDTEGWPAGIYLAALAYEAGGAQGSGRFSFAGDDRLMADYLRTELLSRVGRGRVTFMTRSSVLERMCGPLCDASLDRTHSGQLLEDLDRSNLLVVPLDRRRTWYRYHKLFQQLLRAELELREAEIVDELHARAAAWCEANGHPEMAIDHAQAAGAADQVARLVATHVLATFASGRLETASRWLQWFEDRGEIDRHPPVAILGAALLSISGQAAAADRWAAVAERAPVEGTVPDGSTLRSWRALLRAWRCAGGVARMADDAVEAREGLAPTSRWQPTTWALEGVARLLDGQPDRADAVLAHAVDAAVDIGALPAAQAALAERAVLAIGRGAWEQAADLAARALDVVRGGELDDYGVGALLHAVVARLAARRGDLAEARRELAHAARLRPQLTHAMPVLSVQTLLELGRGYLALADSAGARVVLREARDILRLRPDLGSLPRDVDELQASVDTIRAGALGASSLTNAELRLVPYLSTHLTFPEIAERLHVSRHTVKTQAMSIYRKLGVTSRSEAIERMERIGLLG